MDIDEFCWLFQKVSICLHVHINTTTVHILNSEVKLGIIFIGKKEILLLSFINFQKQNKNSHGYLSDVLFFMGFFRGFTLVSVVTYPSLARDIMTQVTTIVWPNTLYLVISSCLGQAGGHKMKNDRTYLVLVTLT